MERIKRHLRSAAGYLAVCAKWLVLAALVGCVVGPLGGAFGLALNWANATRGAHPWLLYLLPVAGLVIVFLYHRFDPDGGGSTNQIFVSVREHKPLTLRTAPLIFVSTVATHLFGGSSGREGAALLLGGSVSGQLGRALRLENRDCRLMTMCGMAAGFAALGGRVRVEGRTLYAEPGGTLQGTVLEAPDLRGGAALVIAALAAQGSSRITHTEVIDRGYA